MSKPKYDYLNLVKELVFKAEELNEKDIILRTLKGESLLKIAEESNEYSYSDVQEMVVSGLRRAIKNSPYPDGEYTKDQWISLVETGRIPELDRVEKPKKEVLISD